MKIKIYNEWYGKRNFRVFIVPTIEFGQYPLYWQSSQHQHWVTARWLFWVMDFTWKDEGYESESI